MLPKMMPLFHQHASNRRADEGALGIPADGLPANSSRPLFINF